MCMGMRHITSSEEKGNAVNLVDGLHSLSKSLTKCHHSRREVTWHFFKRLDMALWDDQAVTFSNRPSVQERYNVRILPYDLCNSRFCQLYAKRTYHMLLTTT